MLYALDIRTLSLVASIVSLILCVCMLYVSRSRKTYDGFTQWTAASILNSLGMVLLSTRGALPDFITIVVANTLFIAANGAMAYGVEVFVDSTRRTWLFISFVVVIFVLFIYFTYYVPNVTSRIVVVSLMLSVLYGYCAYVVHKYIPRVMNGKNMLLITAFSTLAVWFAFRILSTVFVEGSIVDFMKSSALQGVAFVIFFGGNIFIVVGLITLNSQRVECDLLSAIEEVKILRGIIPICASCKKIRSDEGIWDQLEIYIQEHSEAEFSHGICPECMVKIYPEFVDTDGEIAATELR